MKNFYLFVALVTLSVSALAKGEYEPMITAGPVVNGKFPHFVNQIVNGTNGSPVPSNVSLRLIGRTNANYTGGVFVPVDSYSYSYQDDRGGILNNNNINNDESLLYNESVYYKFDNGSGQFQNILKRTQDYDISDRVISLKYQPWKASPGVWKDSARYLYGYLNGKLDKMTFEQYYANMWTNTETSTIIYTQLVTTMQSDLYKIEFSYDANARLVKMEDWLNMGNGVFQGKEKHTYEYSGGNVSKHVLYEWDPSINNWEFSKNWQYVYNSSNNLTSETEQKWISGGWENVSKHVYSYDANKNLVADEKSDWHVGLGMFVYSSQEVWEYNGQNLPEVITTSNWNGSSWDYTKRYRLYYENYFPSSVNDVAGKDGLNLYPVPATEQLNINMNLTGAEDIAVSLHDVKGVIVHNTRYNVAGALQTSIDVSTLPAGMYFLRVAGDRTNIAKSIVIQH